MINYATIAKVDVADRGKKKAAIFGFDFVACPLPG